MFKLYFLKIRIDFFIKVNKDRSVYHTFIQEFTFHYVIIKFNSLQNVCVVKRKYFSLPRNLIYNSFISSSHLFHFQMGTHLHSKISILIWLKKINLKYICRFYFKIRALFSIGFFIQFFNLILQLSKYFCHHYNVWNIQWSWGNCITYSKLKCQSTKMYSKGHCYVPSISSRSIRWFLYV